MGQQVPHFAPLSRINFGLLIIRVVTGLIFFMHGYQKLFDDGLAATRDGFEAMGVPLPAVTAVIAMVLELVGGIAMLFGVYTRIFSFLFSIEMIAAFFFVHVEHGFFVINGGFELVLLLAAASIGMLIAGGGNYSMDVAMRLPYSEDWKSIANRRRDQPRA